MLGENVSLGQAVGVTVFSMAIVFITLLIISFILTGFKHVFKDENKSKAKVAPIKEEKKETIVESTPAENDDEELVAVITAAIALSMSVSVTDIKIRNIKRVSQNTSPWSRMGRIEQMNG